MTDAGVAATNESSKLKRNALGLVGATILGVVIMSPSLVIFANWGPIIPQISGTATALVFVIALIIVLPTAYSFAYLSHRMPTAGSAYKWASRLIEPRVGIAVGMCQAFYYTLIFAFIPALIGQAVTDLFSTTSGVVFSIALFGAIALVAPLILRGIVISLEAAVVLVAIEVAILSVIGIVALVTSPEGSLTLEPLNPSGIGGISILASALILAVLSFTGFDAVSTVAEETKTPRSIIPKATILSAIVVGLFWVTMAFIFSNAFSKETYIGVLDSGGVPLSFAADEAFGAAGKTLIDIMAIEAAFGVLIGSAIGATRLLYAMGRDGIIPRRFGTLNEQYQVPWFSTGVVFAFAVVVNIVLSIWLGPNLDIYLWLANLVVFFCLLTFIATNFSNLSFGLRRNGHDFHWFKNGVTPIAGILVSSYFLYRAFFDSLWDAGFKMGRSAVIVGLLGLALALLYGFTSSRSRREAAQSRVGDLTDPAEVYEVA